MASHMQSWRSFSGDIDLIIYKHNSKNNTDNIFQAGAWVEALEEFAFSGFDGMMINDTQEEEPVGEPQSDL